MRYFLFSALLACASVACATSSQSQEMDQNLFTNHFAKVSQCRWYVDRFLSQSLQELASKGSVAELRDWVAQHKSNSFSVLVLDVQKVTARHGILDPSKEKDQMIAAQALLDVFSKMQGFSDSACDQVSFRDVFVEVLYQALGGEQGRIAASLRTSDVSGFVDLKWILLTELMAGKVETNQP